MPARRDVEADRQFGKTLGQEVALGPLPLADPVDLHLGDDFTVEPANLFQGLYYRAASFMTRNAPWTYVALAVLGAGILVSILRRFVSLNISFQKRPPQP